MYNLKYNLIILGKNMRFLYWLRKLLGLIAVIVWMTIYIILTINGKEQYSTLLIIQEVKKNEKGQRRKNGQARKIAGKIPYVGFNGFCCNTHMQ